MSMHEAGTNLVKRLQDAGHVAYFAGGSVRDQLLGVEAKDIDIASDATPDQVQQILPRVTDLQGKSFGVVRAMEGEHVFEIATFRREFGYQDGRRPDRVEFTTAEEDAQRRDFTVNGLFFDPVADKLIDFVGGQQDLLQNTIRAIGEPRERFCEDKLRLLRAVRFTTNLKMGQLKFEMEPATWEALKEMAPEIGQVSVERIRDELDKIWTGPAPARGLDLLDASGLLEQPAVLPEIHALHGCDQPPQFHPEGDVWEHVRMMMGMLENAPLELALGVLFHDVAKPATQTVDETGRIRFNGHEHVGAVMTEQIMRRLRYSNDTIKATCELVKYHMQFKDVLRMKVSTLKRMLARDHFTEELELHRIDCSCSHGDLENYHFLKNKRQELAEDDIRPAKLINGHDLMAMGIPPGKQIGEMLEKIEIAQLEGEIETHAEAIKLAKRLASMPHDINNYSIKLESLSRVLPLRAEPRVKSTAKDWENLSTSLLPYPKEYREFIDHYGAGCIDGFLWIFHPTISNTNLNLEHQYTKQLDIISSIVLEDTSTNNIQNLQRTYGLYPFGITDNGDVLFWIRQGDTKDWKIAILEARGTVVEIIDLSLLSFLSNLISGKLKCRAFPNDFPSSNPQFEPII